MKKLILLYMACVSLSFSAVDEYKTDVYSNIKNHVLRAWSEFKGSTA